MQRRLARVVRSVDVGAVFEEKLHHREIVLDASVGQRLRSALGVARVDLRAMLQKQQGDLAIAAPRRIMQGSGAHRIGRVDVGAARDLGLYALEAARFDRLLKVGGGEGAEEGEGGYASKPRIAPPLCGTGDSPVQRSRTGESPVPQG